MCEIEVVDCIELSNGDELCDEVADEVPANILGRGLDDKEVGVGARCETPLRRVPIGVATGATAAGENCANNGGGGTRLVD